MIPWAAFWIVGSLRCLIRYKTNNDLMFWYVTEKEKEDDR
jgi:hypothetical protein